MRGSHLVGVFLLIASALGPAGASAQSPDVGVHVLAGMGVGSLADDEGGLGRGPTIAGALGWHLSETLVLEAAITRVRHERTGSLAWRGTPVMLTARVIKRWGAISSRTRVFAGGGGGYVRYTGTRTDTVFDAPNVSRTVERDWRVQGAAFEGGGGVQIALIRRVFIRPEAWLTVARPERRGIAPEPPYTIPRFLLSAGVAF